MAAASSSSNSKSNGSTGSSIIDSKKRKHDTHTTTKLPIAAMVSRDSIHDSLKKFDPLSKVITKEADTAEDLAEDRTRAYQAGLLMYMSLSNMNPHLAGTPKKLSPAELGDLHTLTSEECKEKFISKLPNFSATHIDELLCKARPRKSPLKPELTIHPKPCINGVKCEGFVPRIKGFTDTPHTEDEKKLGSGFTLVRAMTEPELQRFYLSGVVPTGDDAFKYCVLCMGVMTARTHFTRVPGSGSLPPQTCIQMFGTSEGYAEDQLLHPGETSYNGLVKKMVFFRYDKLKAIVDPKTGMERICQDALKSKANGSAVNQSLTLKSTGSAGIASSSSIAAATSSSSSSSTLTATATTTTPGPTPFHRSLKNFPK